MKEFRTEYGVRPFPKRSRVVTNEPTHRLRWETGGMTGVDSRRICIIRSEIQ